MAARPVVKKPDPQAIYTCIENHASDSGVYRVGDRLRGSHEDVRAVPVFWIEDGATTDEMHEARQARFGFHD